jgi:hypothetical protein
MDQLAEVVDRVTVIVAAEWSEARGKAKLTSPICARSTGRWRPISSRVRAGSCN